MTTTMRDVAQKSGVSTKTVSRVVNQQGEISEATRQRVLLAIKELDYHPNTLARGLVSGRTHSIAVLIPQITDPFYPEFVLGVEQAAHDRGYSVFLCNTDEHAQRELEYAEILASRQVDGIILIGTRLSSKQLNDLASRHPVAVVSSRRLSGTASVRILSELGLYQITSHLIGLGHRAIAHLGWKTESDEERATGYARALAENGIEAEDNWTVFVPQVSIETGRRYITYLLEQAPDTTAVTCYSDLIAIGALQGCEEWGIRVPQDLAIVGFDDIQLASLVKPSLTTMRVPRHKLGSLAMQSLLSCLAHDGDAGEEIEVRPELIIRQSCGAEIPVSSR